VISRRNCIVDLFVFSRNPIERQAPIGQTSIRTCKSFQRRESWRKLYFIQLHFLLGGHDRYIAPAGGRWCCQVCTILRIVIERGPKVKNEGLWLLRGKVIGKEARSLVIDPRIAGLLAASTSRRSRLFHLTGAPRRMNIPVVDQPSQRIGDYIPCEWKPFRVRLKMVLAAYGTGSHARWIIAVTTLVL